MFARAQVIRREPSVAIPPRVPSRVLRDNAPLKPPILLEPGLALREVLAAIARKLRAG